MALFRSRLFAGALFVGALFGASDVSPPITPVTPPVVIGGGGGGIFSIFDTPQTVYIDDTTRRQSNAILAIVAAVIGSGVLD